MPVCVYACVDTCPSSTVLFQDVEAYSEKKNSDGYLEFRGGSVDLGCIYMHFKTFMPATDSFGGLT